MFRFIVIFLSLCISTISAGATASILWEVVHPFRYFKYASDFEIHRIAYLAERAERLDAEPSILAMERRLNRYKWWEEELPQTILQRYAWTGKTTPRDILFELRKREIENQGRLPGFPELAKSLAKSNAAGNRWLQVEYDFRRNGWSSLLFPAHQRPEDIGKSELIDARNVAVCWNRALQRHNNCREQKGDSDYVLPSFHTVSLRVVADGSTSLLGKDCRWSVSGPAGAVFVAPESGVPCEQHIELRIPFEEAVRVQVEAGDLSAAQEIQVRDRLVVGLGDSFSSGEGNPDVPAKLVWTASRSLDPIANPERGEHSDTSLPLRKRSGDYFAAQWIDRACHRSAYSYQLRAAIQLALRNPHSAVTFLSYACSGAEINEGLFNPHDGAEYTTNKQRLAPFARTQLPLLLAELCRFYNGNGVRPKALSDRAEDRLIAEGKYVFGDGGTVADSAAYRCAGADMAAGFKRPIDLLFLSIGGNDAGFAKWIAAAIVPERLIGRDKAFLPRMINDPAACGRDASCGIMTARWKRLESRFRLLREFLDTRLTYRKAGAKPILIYTYPVAVRDEKGALCKSGSSGMTVWGWDLICLNSAQGSTGRLETIEAFAQGPLSAEVARFTAGKNVAEAWVLVNEHTPEFSKRSTCATLVNDRVREGAAREPQDQCLSLRKIRDMHTAGEIGRIIPPRAVETLHIPRQLAQGDWSPFNPVYEHWPYASRQRWLRTMNDIYLLINQQPKNTRENTDTRLLSLAQAGVSGAFHPTAEAHAHVADAFMRQAQRIVSSD